MKLSFTIITIFTIAILLNHVIPLPLSNAQNFTNQDNKLTMKEIECHSIEHFDFHIHTKLIIIIDNQLYPIPANIGIIPEKCIYWLHTHDNSGLIHIESPIKRNFTLGQFLQIWKLFNNSDIVQRLADNQINGNITIHVNNNHNNTSVGTDFSHLVLKDQDRILLNITSHQFMRYF
jgi:hypothetical protein